MTSAERTALRVIEALDVAGVLPVIEVSRWVKEIGKIISEAEAPPRLIADRLSTFQSGHWYAEAQRYKRELAEAQPREEAMNLWTRIGRLWGRYQRRLPRHNTNCRCQRCEDKRVVR